MRRFPDLYIEEVDGCDLLASYAALQRAVDYARQRKGPALVHAHVIRPYSHSLSDDEVMYRPPAERDADAARDPVTHYPKWLVAEGHATEAEIAKIQEEVEAEVLAATDAALAAEQPGPETIYNFVYSPDVDPTSEQFDTEDDPQFSGNETTMVDLLNACMKDEMRRDQKILIFGEDVADVSREEQLGKVKGKGGVFKVTWGLQKEFGGARVYNSPLAEATIVGRAIGLALRGFKPVVEIQFFDYIWPAYMQIRERAGDDALAFERRLRVAGRHSRDVRRLHQRRDLSLADGRVAVHALPRTARRLPGDGARRQRTAAHRDSLRRSGDLPRAQASLSADVQQGRVSRSELHDSVRQGEDRARRHGRHDRDVRRHGAARVRRGEPARRDGTVGRRSSTCARCRRGTRRRCSSR